MMMATGHAHAHAHGRHAPSINSLAVRARSGRVGIMLCLYVPPRAVAAIADRPGGRDCS